MAGEKRSFSSCFIIVIVLAVIAIAILMASMDWIKDRLGLEKPESEAGRLIDELIPQIEAVHQQRKAKRALQLSAHMNEIKKAYARFYIFNDRFPKDLKELVSSGEIDSGALKDLWGQRHWLLEDGREVYLVSPGPDRIYNTADDLAVSMKSPGLELSDEERERILSLVSEAALSSEGER